MRAFSGLLKGHTSSLDYSSCDYQMTLIKAGQVIATSPRPQLTLWFSSEYTVTAGNLAPLNMPKILYFLGCRAYKVVQDFLHLQ